MRLTDYFLGTFVAPGLSRLGKPSLPAVEQPGGSRVNSFILASALVTNVAEPRRAYCMLLARRADGATDAYGEACSALTAFVGGDVRGGTISPYFRALRKFESCISQTYQGMMVVGTMLNADNLFANGDGSPLARMNELYNVVRHGDNKIAEGQIPGAGSLPMWLTNEGLASAEASLTYSELAAAIEDLNRAASQIVDAIGK